MDYLTYAAFVSWSLTQMLGFVIIWGIWATYWDYRKTKEDPKAYFEYQLKRKENYVKAKMLKKLANEIRT